MVPVVRMMTKNGRFPPKKHMHSHSTAHKIDIVNIVPLRAMQDK